MELTVGLQLYSVRESLRKDLAGTLEEIARIGYKALQLTTRGGMEHTTGSQTAAELQTHFQRFGLRVAHIHAKIDAKTDWTRLIAFNQEIGSEAIIIPMGLFTGRQSVLEYASNLNRYGELCARHGTVLYYHNHFHEFKPVDADTTILDILLENTDRSLVRFELDTYWAVRGGADPVTWLLKLGDRCDITHVKDMSSSAQPLNWYDHFGKDADITLKELEQTSIPAHFAEIGEGIMNIRELIGTMRATGVRYIVVEQDLSQRGELESIGIDYVNLTRLLRAEA
jgi:sugar phosphate isomerase/epimerase